MRLLTILAFLFISPIIHAGNAAIANHIEAEINMLSVQVEHLESAVRLIQSGLKPEERYERIAEPVFRAVDQSLSQSGLTLQSFYQFKARYQSAIDAWLNRHTATAGKLRQLRAKRDNLTRILDGAN